MITQSSQQRPDGLQRLIRSLREQEDPLSAVSREFFTNNWIQCRDGLLSKTTRIRVNPQPLPAPCNFDFEIDTPFKQKRGRNAPVELNRGPVRGRICYREDMFEQPDGPCLAVLIDPDLAYFHPNHSRSGSFLCVGELSDLPPGPLPLDQLLENHLFPILSYQNRRPTHPADLEAARYFATDPAAMEGLEPVIPLY